MSTPKPRSDSLGACTRDLVRVTSHSDEPILLQMPGNKGAWLLEPRTTETYDPDKLAWDAFHDIDVEYEYIPREESP
jgi:hypothetical protein